MRDYLAELRDNWRDDYWRADHPEFQVGIAIAGFVVMSLLKLAFNLFELSMTRRITNG